MIRAVGTSPLEAALELAPRAAELAPEAVRERRVGAAFSSELAAAGLYRACVPASLSGGESLRQRAETRGSCCSHRNQPGVKPSGMRTFLVF